ncbi:hypothetical protein Musp01_21140 [Muricauda sp. NBRC 101325]|nr:hypothetical protein Musp01_21140 [Muricauda sp. NBRC 101325]
MQDARDKTIDARRKTKNEKPLTINYPPSTINHEQLRQDDRFKTMEEGLRVEVLSGKF